MNDESKEFRRLLNELSRFHRANIEDEAIRILGSKNIATIENVNALVSFVMSIGHFIKAMSITGSKTPEYFGGPSEEKLFLCAFSSETEILRTISKVGNFKAILGVRIDTKRVSSAEDLKAIGTVIVSVCKVLQILSKGSLPPISDQFPVNDEVVIHILFEGMYDMNYLTKNPIGTGINLESYRTVQKNVYIFGPNGAGKSTWGNIISEDETRMFMTGNSVHTTMMPQYCDVGEKSPSETFRLWDLPGIYEGTEYAAVMQRHITDIINNNLRYSAVLFIFNGSHQPNLITDNILDYAVELFGPAVRMSFIAIVNNIGWQRK